MDASCSLKEGLTKASASPDFCAPDSPTNPLLAEPFDALLVVATECIEPVCVPLVEGVDSALGRGFRSPGVTQRELGALLVVGRVGCCGVRPP